MPTAAPDGWGYHGLLYCPEACGGHFQRTWKGRVGKQSKRIRQEIYPHVIENMQTSAEGAQDFLDPPILPALVREVQRCDCLVGGCHCGGVHLNVRATAQRPQHFLEYDCMCTNASSKLCFSRHQACSLSTIPAAPPLPLHHFWF